ncbi:MAG TPA: hypothetical protein VE994_07600 [Terriglobales bacterium]|nr:hypothetical protein [Terriglobales bacterium]
MRSTRKDTTSQQFWPKKLDAGTLPYAQTISHRAGGVVMGHVPSVELAHLIF